jgi:N-acetylglucosamine-6-phosphate deacetylase
VELLARQVVTPAGIVGPAVVTVDNGRITAVEPTDRAVADRTLVPGFVDLQVNGIAAVDVASARDGDWDVLDAALLAQGVTTWCPTLVTAPLDAYAAPLAAIAAAADRPGSRPTIAGAHLEGPFLGGAPGAHPRGLIVAPDLDWIAAIPPIVRLVTLAPEAPGALAAIAALVTRGIVVSAGHSTADFATATAAFDAGVRLVTHGFNGMGPLHHREPGLVGAALTDDRVAVSFIADLVHVHPAALRLGLRAKGPGRAVLVTDAVAWEALRVGRIQLAFDGAAPRLADGTLAGSALTMDRAVGNLVRACGISLADAVMAASTVPAGLLGLTDRGAIAAGRRADLVALTPSFEVAATWVGGEQVLG